MERKSFPGAARIYVFPAGGRKAAAARIMESRRIAELEARGVEMTVAGSGWYHEAEILAAAEAGKRARESQVLPWWAEAEKESRAKAAVRRIY